ncbi:hypothetical protein AAEP93_006328 [Penicillium crustosum]
MAANPVGSPGLVFEPILTEARVASWFHQSSPKYTHMVRHRSHRTRRHASGKKD